MFERVPESEQMQFSELETLFPTNNPNLLRKDEVASGIGFLTIGGEETVQDVTITQEEAIDRALATEEFTLRHTQSSE